MFYCESCRVQNEWPKTLNVKSEGVCEICGEVRVCHDVSGALLNDPARFRATELALIDRGGRRVLEAIRDDRPADEVEKLMVEFLSARRAT